MRTLLKQKGFTIVELLIVVVVIAILAAITIVSYNGITQRAKLSKLQSDLATSATTLELFKINSGSDRYPDTIDEGKLKSSAGVTLGYVVNNTGTPSSFCLYGDDGTSRYTVSSTNLTPRAGSCTITNLVANPSYSTDTAGWGTNGYGAASTATSARTANIGPTNGYAMRVNWSTAATSGGHSTFMVVNTPIVSGKTYTMSAWMRTSQPMNNVFLRAVYGTVTVPTSAQSFAANTWTRLSLTFTATQNASSINVDTRLNDLAGTTNGLLFDTTNYMLTEGDTLYTYADGTSAGWNWAGNAGASPSSGPAL